MQFFAAGFQGNSVSELWLFFYLCVVSSCSCVWFSS